MVCRALSSVVVETWVECCAVERGATGVEAPEIVDSRLVAMTGWIRIFLYAIDLPRLMKTME